MQSRSTLFVAIQNSNFSRSLPHFGKSTLADDLGLPDSVCVIGSFDDVRYASDAICTIDPEKTIGGELLFHEHDHGLASGKARSVRALNERLM